VVECHTLVAGVFRWSWRSKTFNGPISGLHPVQGPQRSFARPIGFSSL